MALNSTVDLHVIVIMCSEFLGERPPALPALPNYQPHAISRAAHRRQGLMRAVVAQRTSDGGEFDEALAERLIASVRGREDELPLLQHGLMLMWTTRSGEQGRARAWLKVQSSRGGRPPELLSDHADDVIAQIAPDEWRERMVEAVFRALTDVNSEDSAIRRPLAFPALRGYRRYAGSASPIVDAFRAPGVSFLTPFPPTPIDDKTVIDISHEALIRCWWRIQR